MERSAIRIATVNQFHLLYLQCEIFGFRLCWRIFRRTLLFHLSGCSIRKKDGHSPQWFSAWARLSHMDNDRVKTEFLKIIKRSAVYQGRTKDSSISPSPGVSHKFHPQFIPFVPACCSSRLMPNLKITRRFTAILRSAGQSLRVSSHYFTCKLAKRRCYLAIFLGPCTYVFRMVHLIGDIKDISRA